MLVAQVAEVGDEGVEAGVNTVVVIGEGVEVDGLGAGGLVGDVLGEFLEVGVGHGASSSGAGGWGASSGRYIRGGGPEVARYTANQRS